MSEKMDLKIENDMFAGMRTTFNDVLMKTIKEMIKKDVDQSDITLKLTIKIFSSSLGNVPYMSHKITSKIQTKNEQSGGFGNARTVIIYDEESGSYRLVRADDGQTSLLGEEEEEEDE